MENERAKALIVGLKNKFQAYKEETRKLYSACERLEKENLELKRKLSLYERGILCPKQPKESKS